MLKQLDRPLPKAAKLLILQYTVVLTVAEILIIANTKRLKSKMLIHHLMPYRLNPRLILVLALDLENYSLDNRLLIRTIKEVSKKWFKGSCN